MRTRVQTPAPYKKGKEQEGETKRRREKRGEEKGRDRGEKGRELDQQTEDLMCPCTLAAYNMFLHSVDYRQQFEQL